jgi:hypothetical protein
VLRVPIVLSFAAVIVGVVWIYTVGSLFGAVLIIGGIGGLGWAMVPDVLDGFVRFLSTGTFHN